MTAAEPAFRPPRRGASVLPPGPDERRRILVVDDEPGVCYMARRVLESRFEVREAASGEEALRLLESEAFHIAIVDVRLPGISGLDLLTTVKTLSPHTDVIVMTGSAVDVDEALEGAIRRRAFFFLRKPFPMTILETLAARVAEKQDLEEQLDRYTRTLERNLESARIFQRRLLPEFSWRGESARIAGAYHPSEQLGGDFFDYWPLPAGGTGIVVADVMGHGPLAAMVTGIVKSQLRSLSAEILDPGEVLEALEEELERVALPSFLSAILIFDRPDEGELSWSGAGHPPGLLWTPGLRPEVDPPEALVAEGMLLNTGLPRQARRSRSRRRISGSRLILYTDGYPETVDLAGVPFDRSPVEPSGSGANAPGDDGFFAPDSPFCRAAIRALAAESPEAGISLLEAERKRFAADLTPADDRAAVLAFLD